MKGWSRKYDEYMYLNSRRIAPFGLYTSRSDIPRYQTYGNPRGGHNFAHVVDSGGAAGEDRAEENREGAGNRQEDDIFGINDPLPQILEEANEDEAQEEGEEQ